MRIKRLFIVAAWLAFAVVVLLSVLFLAGIVLVKWSHLVFNTSTCEPLGIYQLEGSPFPLHDGEMVEVQIPGPAHHPAVAEGLKYHWFPAGQPWIKEIAALPGQTVVLKRQGVWVDGHYLPNSHVDRRTPGQKHAIIHYPFGTYHLKAGQVWLYAPGNYAFDSSYYGPVPEIHILEKARPWRVIPGSQYWLVKRSD
ncbi:S26 family signal peptidase [Acidithiobacillus montserratensis]|uniref:S26 family signal peptidase n=1 Tax=Acidithiobacillus montserratensis TaxID=2729135 RepID=A0ACD5HI65_9PROT|nr:S26 family signal peptidase [Acidithiobacillus montserratensis]MBU2746586.1 conjugal transfer protein TraF [Acidithiobacillus montserratensis]